MTLSTGRKEPLHTIIPEWLSAVWIETEYYLDVSESETA
jgi:hypothetical protein